MIGPKYANIDLGLGEKTAIHIISKAFEVSEGETKSRFARLGDLGDVVQALSKREHSSLKIDNVYDVLREVESNSGARIVGIRNGKVLIVGRGGSEELPRELPADTVVASTGAKPNDSLADELRKVAKQVFVVGDAVEPRDVTYAMLEGARAGLL